MHELTGQGSAGPSQNGAPLIGGAGEAPVGPSPLARPHDSTATASERVTLLGDLAQLLVEPGEREALVSRALRVGAELAPAIARWQVYVVAPHEPGTLVLTAERDPEHTGKPSRPTPSSPSPRRSATLGLGAAVDRAVIERRRRVLLSPPGRDRPPRLRGDRDVLESESYVGVCLPLVSSDGQLRGVLVALADPRGELTSADVQLLETLAHHLTAIVARPGGSEAAGAAETRAEVEPDPRIEFISLAAHELRSPLTSVKGYAQLLLRATRKNPALPENQLRALQAIEQQAGRMSDMVGELLDAARIQRGTLELQPRLVDLEGLVRRVVEQRRQGLERHELRLEPDAVTLVGRWDPQRLEQVIRDLVDNAIRFSPEGGVVLVRVSHQGHFAHVCVEDEGIGVSPEERDRIFEAFYRGEEARQRNLAGLGLGLFVSRTIIHALGGRLWLDAPATPVSPAAEPSARRGSVFCLELPLAGAGTGTGAQSAPST